jgi:hypothetical protein
VVEGIVRDISARRVESMRLGDFLDGDDEPIEQIQCKQTESSADYIEH